LRYNAADKITAVVKVEESGAIDNDKIIVDYTTNVFDGETYQASGVILPSDEGYVKDFARSDTADWLLMPSAVGGNSGSYVPDYYYQNWNGDHKIDLVGGAWNYGYVAGLFNLIIM
jgi:hypothetical protein